MKNCNGESDEEYFLELMLNMLKNYMNFIKI